MTSRARRRTRTDHAKPAARRVVPFDAYPLRTVSGLTGLSPDLIRAWEKRYGVVTPIRGPRGARLYTATDIDHLRLLARAVGGGRAIGDVAGLSREELERLTGATEPEPPAHRDELVRRLIELLEAFDHSQVERMLGDALIGLGCRAFVHQVASPLLNEVGERWSLGELSIANEHLFSATLLKLLASLIHARPRSGSRTAVLATPAGERHEFGLLLVALLALDAGLDLLYLGTDVPADEIVAAVRRSDARMLGLSVVSDVNRSFAIHEVQAIQDALPATVELWLGGRDAEAVATRLGPFRGAVFGTLSQAEVELARLGRLARMPH